MRARLIVIVTSICLLVALALVAQDIPQDELHWGSKPYVPEIAAAPAIRVESDLVEIPTTVRDARGNPVANLTKDDFLLFDNGKPQTISTFSVLLGPGSSAASGAPHAAPEAAPPAQSRYVALYFDDVNTGAGRLNLARDAAIKFIGKGLDPGERAGIFTASGTLSLDFTDDVQKLLDTLATLEIFQRMPDQPPFACPTLTPYQAWEILHGAQNVDTRNPNDESAFGVAIRAAKGCGCTYDAENCVRNAAEYLVGNAEGHSLDTFASLTDVVRHLGQMPGRRILALTSSGFLTLSLKREQEKVVEAALHASVVINTLDSAGVVYDDPFGTHFNMKLPLSDLAAETGGKFIQNGNDLSAGFRALTSVPSVSYVLGFSPENLRADGTLHNLKVKLAIPERLTISARPGYYAPGPELTHAEKKFRKLQASVQAAENSAEIPIEFTAVPATQANGEHYLKVLVHVDVRKLPFLQMSNDRHGERLIFITALFDTKNQFVVGVEGVMDLLLRKATLKQLSAQGLDAKLSIQAPPGTYRVRQVVQESASGRIAAVSREVEIH